MSPSPRVPAWASGLHACCQASLEDLSHCHTLPCNGITAHILNRVVVQPQQESCNPFLVSATRISHTILRCHSRAVSCIQMLAGYSPTAISRLLTAECCIFHRRRAFGDWSDSDDSDQECDCPEPTDNGDKGPDDGEPSKTMQA